MKALSAELQAHLAEDVTQLALCWRLTRADGRQLTLTSHDQPIEYEGMRYQPSSGLSAAALRQRNDFAVDGGDLQGLLDDRRITRADLMAGRYDYARLVLFWVNWQQPEMGHIPLYQGSLGEIRLNGGVFEGELRGLTQRLQAPVGQMSSPECRADLGDEKCQVTTRSFWQTGVVESDIDGLSFSDSGRTEAVGWFDYGQILWLTGENAGQRSEVKHSAGAVIILQDKPPAAMAVGDKYRLMAGCDRRVETCRNKFDNLINFQGEPQVPGLDAVLAYPDSA